MRPWLLLVLAALSGCTLAKPAPAPTCDEVIAWPAVPVDCVVAGGVFGRSLIDGVAQAACSFCDASDEVGP